MSDDTPKKRRWQRRSASYGTARNRLVIFTTTFFMRMSFLTPIKTHMHIHMPRTILHVSHRNARIHLSGNDKAIGTNDTKRHTDGIHTRIGDTYHF